MTIASLLLGTIISQILFVLTKVFFIGSLNMDNLVVVVLFYTALVLETIVVVRRMGVLNYIEAFFLAFVWLFTLLVVDFIVTSNWIGRDIYTTLNYWLTYLVIILALLIFHKKLHVQVRKSQIK
jgi:hypothetical protein